MDRLLGALASLVAPPLCAACRSPAASRQLLCAECAGALDRTPEGFQRESHPAGIELTWSAAPYVGVPRAVVSALKFRGSLPLAAAMAAAIAEGAPPALVCGALVPVPASPARLRHRGFDPAAEIAARLARLTGLPLIACLGRSNGPRQVGRSRAERLADPPQVFSRGPVPPVVTIVDDVLTTGATLSVCGRSLRAAGTRRVRAVTFARAD